MNLDDFKFIYWMEYAHRMWGRALGVMFALPFSYFIRKGYINLRLGVRLAGLFALGGGQGMIGWWMVKSGLEVSIIFLSIRSISSRGGKMDEVGGLGDGSKHWIFGMGQNWFSLTLSDQ